MQYNDWTILEHFYKRCTKSGCKLVLCQCKCGSIKELRLTYVVKGRSKCCKSCSAKKNTRLADMKRTHGDSSKESIYYKLYRCWKQIKSRCYIKSTTHYERYGGRGITVCDDWLNDYLNFKLWAINNGWEKNLTIDRIDIDGNYCPENCRWITSFENTSNMSNYHYIMKTGGHSDESILKRKIKNTEKYGIEVLLTCPNGDVLEFPSVKALAEWLAPVLDRGITSVYSHAKQCINHNKNCSTIGGYYVSRKT